MNHDLHSSPTADLRWPSSPTTPCRSQDLRASETPLQWASSWTDDEEEKDISQDSVTESILSTRKNKYKSSFPAYASSPTKSRIEDHQRHMKQLRDNKRNHKAVRQRGGLQKMESFVMSSENSQELQRLSLQAQEHALTPDLAEKFEKEQQEDLEDYDLINYIEHRDQLDQELETMIAELSLK